MEMEFNMSLCDDINTEIGQGRLANTWTTANLVANANLRENYAESTLRTEPPNLSTSQRGLNLGDGYHVRSGATAVFERIGRRGGALLYRIL